MLLARSGRDQNLRKLCFSSSSSSFANWRKKHASVKGTLLLSNEREGASETVEKTCSCARCLSNEVRCEGCRKKENGCVELLSVRILAEFVFLIYLILFYFQCIL